MSPQAHLESGHEKFFLERVRAAGGILVKLIPVTKGMPDRLVLWPDGRAFLVELKTKDARMAERGHPVAVLWGRDQILAWLRERDAEGLRGARRPCPECGKTVSVKTDGALRSHHCEKRTG